TRRTPRGIMEYWCTQSRVQTERRRCILLGPTGQCLQEVPGTTREGAIVAGFPLFTGDVSSDAGKDRVKDGVAIAFSCFDGKRNWLCSLSMNGLGGENFIDGKETIRYLDFLGFEHEWSGGLSLDGLGGVESVKTIH